MSSVPGMPCRRPCTLLMLLVLLSRLVMPLSPLGPPSPFSLASRYMSRRRACAQALRQHPRAASSKYSVRLASNFDVQGPLLRPPYFFGGRPRLAEPSLEEGVPDPELANLVRDMPRHHPGRPHSPPSAFTLDMAACQPSGHVMR